MLEILTHSLFRHTILWDSFLYLSDVMFLLNVDFAYSVYGIHISAGVSLVSVGSHIHCTCILFYNASKDYDIKYDLSKHVFLTLI